MIRVLRARSSALADQLERALISIPLNVAEGAYSRGKNRQARFQSAAASARETLACLETAEAMGFIGPLDTELGALFHRVIGTRSCGSSSRGADGRGAAQRTRRLTVLDADAERKRACWRKCASPIRTRATSFTSSSAS
jgi:four helix bundle protein